MSDNIKIAECKNNISKLCGLCETCINRSLFIHPCHTELKDKTLDPKTIFKKSNQKLEWICQICNFEWPAIVKSRTTNGYGCPQCGILKMAKTKKICKNINESLFMHPCHLELKDKTLDPKTISKSSHQNLEWICKDCNFEWMSTVNNRTRTNESNCPKCGRIRQIKILKTCKDLEKSLFIHPCHLELKDKTLDPKTIYISSGQKLEWICKDCNFEWTAVVANRTNGSGCPNCRFKTEKKLYEWLLKRYKEVIKKQKKFHWCKNKKSQRELPFDFYINCIKLIIELDGAQHFIQVSNWSSPEKNLKRDIKKMRNAINNGMTVIRISQEDVLYDRMNWEERLEKAISRAGTKPKIRYIASDPNLYNKHKAAIEKIRIR